MSASVHREIRLPGTTGPLTALQFGVSEGKNVLALHGWLDNAASFVPLSDYLAAVNLVALDLPGHGHSAHRPAGCGYHLSDYPGEIQSAANALGWAQFDLIGHSLGAGIACLYAAVMPQQIRRLVFIDGLGPVSTEHAQAPQQLAKSLHARLQLQEKMHRPRKQYTSWEQLVAARQAANRICAANAELLVRRAARQRGDRVELHSDRRLKSPSTLYLSEQQVAAFMQSIRCPVLLLQATDGILARNAQLRSRIQWLDQVRVEHVPGQHHVHMDQPQRVAELINAFLG